MTLGVHLFSLFSFLLKYSYFSYSFLRDFVSSVYGIPKYTPKYTKTYAKKGHAEEVRGGSVQAESRVYKLWQEVGRLATHRGREEHQEVRSRGHRGQAQLALLQNG